MSEQQQEVAVVEQPQETNLVFDTTTHFELAQRMARCLSTSSMLPEHFRGDANLGNVMIGLEIANRGKLPVMEVFQNMYIVKGKVSWSGAYLIGRVNTATKRFTGLRWEMQNEGRDDWRCRAYSNDRLTGETLYGSWVSLEMANKEGWGSKWKSMPEQMLRYRSAAFWVRAYAPDIAMGIPMADEVQDVQYTDVTNMSEEEKERQEQKQEKARSALASALNVAKPSEKKPTTSIKDKAITAVVVEPVSVKSKLKPETSPNLDFGDLGE